MLIATYNEHFSHLLKASKKQALSFQSQKKLAIFAFL